MKTAAELTREIKAFLATQKKRGGGYRDAAGNYSPALYDEHNRLVGDRYDAKKREASIAKLVREAKSHRAAALKRWHVLNGDGKLAYVASKAGPAGERQANDQATRLTRARGGYYYAVPPGTLNATESP